jgi:hypothetical protein
LNEKYTILKQIISNNTQSVILQISWKKYLSSAV